METTSTGRPAGKTGPIARAVIGAETNGDGHNWPYYCAAFSFESLEFMDHAMTRDEAVKERAA